MVRVAARIGYRGVGLRLIAVTDDSPGYAIMDDAVMMRETKAALADTGLRLSLSVRRVLESYESSVIQEWWPDSRRGHRCGRTRTAPVTTAASCAIRAI